MYPPEHAGVWAFPPPGSGDILKRRSLHEVGEEGKIVRFFRFMVPHLTWACTRTLVETNV
jgi:hypothetical protein